MGNTSSNANTIHPKSRTSSESPGLAPHRSLRTKKKSLELPDLATLGLTSTPNHYPRQPAPVSIPINIPNSVNGAPTTRGRPPPPDFSSTEHIADIAPYEPSTHIPVAPNRNVRGGGPYFRGGHTARNSTRDFISSAHGPTHRGRSQYAHPYYSANHPSIPSVLNHPPPNANNQQQPKFVQEIVHSCLPVPLEKSMTDSISSPVEEEAASPTSPDPVRVPVTVKITWRGGGRNVVLARAGDDDWMGRQAMEQDPTCPTTFTTSVSLLPGTHHLRFLVDDVWRVADDLPTAVDDQGTLANYVAIPVPPGSTPPSTTKIPPSESTGLPSPKQKAGHPTLKLSPPNATPPKLQPGQSFWSSTSSADDDGPSSSYSHTYHHREQKNQPGTPKHKHHPSPAWTTEIPLELIEAAREEEAYLAASAQHHQNGFIPAPNIPPAPGLPRHLDRLILNVKSPGVGLVGVRREGRSTPGSGSNTGGSKRDKEGRDREERERDGRQREKSLRRRERDREKVKERERDKERASSPPSIPAIPRTPASPVPDKPATTPVIVQEPVVEVASGDMRAVVAGGDILSLNGVDRSGANAAAAAAAASAAGGDIQLIQVPTIPITTASGTDVTAEHLMSMPASLTTTVVATTAATSTVTSTTTTATGTPASASATSVSTVPASQSQSTSPTITQSGPTSAGVRGTPLGIPLSLDIDGPGLADDTSVLPVPSHVVLHHLTTSAIRNGVLAVGSTVRYRKKYLTTIYYKPT